MEEEEGRSTDLAFRRLCSRGSPVEPVTGDDYSSNNLKSTMRLERLRQWLP